MVISFFVELAIWHRRIKVESAHPGEPEMVCNGLEILLISMHLVKTEYVFNDSRSIKWWTIINHPGYFILRWINHFYGDNALTMSSYYKTTYHMAVVFLVRGPKLVIYHLVESYLTNNSRWISTFWIIPVSILARHCDVTTVGMVDVHILFTLASVWICRRGEGWREPGKTRVERVVVPDVTMIWRSIGWKTCEEKYNNLCMTL